MSCEESQEEELEVLRSIYNGDPDFKEVSPKNFQYMVGEKGSPHSFLMEICWGENYPNTKPDVNLDAFYNKHIPLAVKSAIKEKFLEEAEQQLGTAMTYTLIEWAKEQATELMADVSIQTEQPNSDQTETVLKAANNEPQSANIVSSAKVKAPKLSKQQKRRLADRVDARGERPRGWDWVDIIRHLSQTASTNS